MTRPRTIAAAAARLGAAAEPATSVELEQLARHQ
jgi:hypothetical protein